MNEIRKKNTAELTAHINEKRAELREIRFKAAGSGMRDTKAIRAIKKEIAQSLTQLHTQTGDNA